MYVSYALKSTGFYDIFYIAFASNNYPRWSFLYIRIIPNRVVSIDSFVILNFFSSEYIKFHFSLFIKEDVHLRILHITALDVFKRSCQLYSEKFLNYSGSVSYHSPGK